MLDPRPSVFFLYKQKLIFSLAILTGNFNDRLYTKPFFSFFPIVKKSISFLFFP